ncbi:B-cadherin-like [Cheilinus undulatus]|uniref:B-cadherin-like n=1 Tax=Cheilinus undulatus TaxID=241271 RepID=UPI001BD6C724|nr:B-cadherin-like [Cheilinus undulatus]
MEKVHLSLFIMLCFGVYKSSSEILHRQKRDWIIDSFKIYENYSGSYPYELGKIRLDRNFTVFHIEGQGVKEEPINTLAIDENTGVIQVHRPVDYETYQVLKVKFKAVNKKNNEIDTKLGVEIIIVDANDNPPKFVPSMYNAKIPESTKQGTDVIRIKATDEDSDLDGELDYKIIKVVPKNDHMEFYLTEIDATKTAIISFRGCLEYMKAHEYTIIVEAKDHGRDRQLSGTCTVQVEVTEANNHLPVITGKTGPGRVKEGEKNVNVLRLQVKDEDAKGTPAWKAKYTIHGDTNKNFGISTDPETNEGILVVEKPLDYEESHKKNLNITVENEIPFSSCKVNKRPKTGLWDVTMSDKAKEQAPFQVTVNVEDVNDAPVFLKTNKKVSVKENVAVGHYLETFKAEDHDGNGANKISYRKGEDKAGFVSVDPKTGKVTTSRLIDRESSFVKNNTYIVNILASDNAHPPMTGTATLTIYIFDENDNAPSLAKSIFDICQSSKPPMANIEAFDLDEGANGGPFSFKLLGDVKGKWRIEPPQGHSVNLIKDSQVHSGRYDLQLQVSDLKQMSKIHNLTVTVCKCKNPQFPNCVIRQSLGSAKAPFVGIIFLALLLAAAILLMALFVRCKGNPPPPINAEGSQHLMKSNIEKPGTDCKVVFKPKQQEIIKQEETTIYTPIDYPDNVMPSRNPSLLKTRDITTYGTKNDQGYEHTKFTHVTMGGSSSMRRGQQNSFSVHGGQDQRWGYSEEQNLTTIQTELLPKVLHGKLYTLQSPGEELLDYGPRVYAEENDREPNDVLDAISIPELSFDPNMQLDPRFNHLASVCMTNANTYHSHKSVPVVQKVLRKT